MKTWTVQLEVMRLEVVGGAGHCCMSLNDPASIMVKLTLDEGDVQELQGWLAAIQGEEEEGHGEDSDL